MAQSDQPPAYPTHAAIPPSSEATTAPAYTPRYPSFEEHDDTSPLRTSRSLPPSRPLQRPDCLELTNQSTTINIGQAAQTQAPETPDNTTPIPTKKSGKGDTCDGVIALFFFCFFAALLITMVYSALFLRRDSAAFNENSRALKNLKYEMSHTKKTVTQTLTAVIRESAVTVTKGITEKVTETVTQTVNGGPSARDVWMTSIGNARG
ncbi:hypothetical protein KCU78_g4022, partial [Aureobasidium melanogenum]